MSFTTETLPSAANWAQVLGTLPLTGALAAVYVKHQCHVHGCKRLAWHPHPTHGHPVCKRHHPRGGGVASGRPPITLAR